MTGALAVFREQFRRIFSLGPVFAILILGSAVYAVFYPQPYLNEALRNVPVSLVDRDGTTMSREFARNVDASQDVAIADQYADIVSAERAVFDRRTYGILYIPQHFERDILHGRQAPVAVYGDASYFLIYQRVAGAVSTVAATLGARVEAARLVGAGVDPALAGAAVDPMPLTAVPLFNPEGGYASYVLPAAFVLILQQILLIGVGLLETLPGGEALRGRAAGPVATVTGKLCVYLALEAFLLPIYLIVLPRIYGLPFLGSVPAVLVFAIPFVLAVGGLGLVVSALFRSPLAVQLVMASLGLPFFFLAGFSWPLEAMPEAVRLLALLVPSSTAIGGFVAIAEQGADLHDVKTAFITLWVLAALFAGIAILQEVWRREKALTKDPAIGS